MKETTIIVDYHPDTGKEYITAHEGDLYSRRDKARYTNYTFQRENIRVHVIAWNRSISELRAKEIARSFVDSYQNWKQVNLND